MNPDLMLVAGLLLVILSFPALISAFAAGNPLRGAIGLGAVGAGMMVTAGFINPEGYRPGEIPHVILSVIADFIR